MLLFKLRRGPSEYQVAGLRSYVPVLTTFDPASCVFRTLRLNTSPYVSFDILHPQNDVRLISIRYGVRAGQRAYFIDRMHTRLLAEALVYKLFRAGHAAYF